MLFICQAPIDECHRTDHTEHHGVTYGAALNAQNATTVQLYKMSHLGLKIDNEIICI